MTLAGLRPAWELLRNSTSLVLRPTFCSEFPSLREGWASEARSGWVSTVDCLSE